MVAYGYFDTVYNNSPSVTGRMVNIDEIYKFKRHGKNGAPGRQNTDKYLTLPCHRQKNIKIR